MNRREAIRNFLAFSIAGIVYKSFPGNLNSMFAQTNLPQIYSPETINKFNEIIKKANDEGWQKLPIGFCMAKVAMEFIDTPYVGNTLEGSGPEVCRINFSGMDCVTFFEAALYLARIIKKGKTNFSDLINEVTYTRYRNGLIEDYTSRLHYTADWLFDNIKKGVVKDITKEIGGVKFSLHVSFMSHNPGYYQALKEHPEFVTKIENIEKEINNRKYFYIPKKKLQSEEKHLQTGDIIAIATDKQGLDYSHTGLILLGKDNIPHFVHASLKQKKVVFDSSIYSYIKSIKSDIGITVLRPVFEE
ncbi:MAG: N-acetylmuramoyl-L-alanine amidase-like domain-containing protein [FCB group bacterium]|jgi:hypothetical protein